MGNFPIILEKGLSTTSTEFTLIAYVLAAKIDNEKCSTGSMGEVNYREVLYQTSILVYNKKGEIVATIISNGTNCRQSPVITNNGRYMAFSYGDMLEDFVNVRDGYCIYDLKERKLLVDKKVASMNGCTCYLDFIKCSYSNNPFIPSYRTLALYSLTNRILYTKSFERELYSKHKSIMRDGISFLH